jgi:hypothetical protein
MKRWDKCKILFVRICVAAACRSITWKIVKHMQKTQWIHRFSFISSRKKKLVNNRQMADYTEIIGRLPIIKNWPIIERLIGLAD